MSVPLEIKWGKETIEVSFMPQAGVKGLKTELEEKTGVPADRMKLMAKSKGLWKGVLKDDVDLASIDWAAAQSKAGNGGKLHMLLMGSATKLTGPKQKTVFIEDLPPEEVAKVQEPSGLVNLGNTCYLNSVLQCLRRVPQLRSGLERYRPRDEDPVEPGALLQLLTITYKCLDTQTEPFKPGMLVQATQVVFPQFAQRGPQGQPMQQDAEEFLSHLMAMIASETRGAASIVNAFPDRPPTNEELMGADNLVDAVFGLKMKETLTCDEFADKMDTTGTGDAAGAGNADDGPVEPPVVSYDLARKLVCNIQGGSDSSAQVNVSHIAEGINLSLSGKIEKHSDILGRNAIWTRTQRIARLPPVLVVQFGRFYWKATPDSQDHQGVKCKVMKPVTFQSTLDVYDFCTFEIQKVLKVARDKARQAEEDRINKRLKGEGEEQKEADVEDSKMDTDESAVAGTKKEQEVDGGAAPLGAEDDEDLQAALAMSMEAEQPPVGPGLPSDFQGVYELFAVVTHKGRDADGGHYMAWVKSSHASPDAKKIADTDEVNEDWFVFDDDEVSPCKTEDVLKLKGGGDWHMSYLNFYRAKK